MVSKLGWANFQWPHQHAVCQRLRCDLGPETSTNIAHQLQGELAIPVPEYRHPHATNNGACSRDAPGPTNSLPLRPRIHQAKTCEKFIPYGMSSDDTLSKNGMISYQQIDISYQKIYISYPPEYVIIPTIVIAYDKGINSYPNMSFHTVKVLIHTCTCHCILVLFHTKTCHVIPATTCFIRIRNVSYVPAMVKKKKKKKKSTR